MRNTDISFFFLSQLILPPVVLALPFLVLYKELALLDTRIGLILVYTLAVLPIVIWIMRDQFSAIPIELEEAALVDGLGDLGRVPAHRAADRAAGHGGGVHPVARALTWNEYFFAALLTSTRANTLPVMVASQTGSQGINWWAMAALSSAAILPLMIIGVLLERYIIKGMAAGAVKVSSCTLYSVARHQRIDQRVRALERRAAMSFVERRAPAKRVLAGIGRTAAIRPADRVPGGDVVRARGADRQRRQERVAVARADGLLADDLVAGRRGPRSPAARRGSACRRRPRGRAAARRRPRRSVSSTCAVPQAMPSRTARKRSPRVWVRFRPKNAPLGQRVVDRGPLAGEVGQAEQAARRPGGAASASAASALEGGRGARSRASSSRNQRVSVPEVARPAIEACRPGKSQGAYQSRASRTGAPVSSMMKTVEPYISIMSPGARTPTLTASAAASTVPTVTGVPSARPVSAAAAARSRGRRSRSTSRAAGSGRAAGDVGREVGGPVEALDVVERAEVRRRV